ncbi:hypothetical protein ALC57_04024, partial [Trachymyrmex cornetzi]
RATKRESRDKDAASALKRVKKKEEEKEEEKEGEEASETFERFATPRKFDDRSHDRVQPITSTPRTAIFITTPVTIRLSNAASISLQTRDCSLLLAYSPLAYPPPTCTKRRSNCVFAPASVKIGSRRWRRNFFQELHTVLVGEGVRRDENGIEIMEESGVDGGVSGKMHMVRALDNAGEAGSRMGEGEREGRDGEREAATIANGRIGGCGEVAAVIPLVPAVPVVVFLGNSQYSLNLRSAGILREEEVIIRCWLQGRKSMDRQGLGVSTGQGKGRNFQGRRQ